MRQTTSFFMSAVLTIALAVQPASSLAEDIRHSLVSDVSADRIEKDIRKLVSFGTRHSLSETESDMRGIGAARRWIEDEFNRISQSCGGCLQVITVSDVISG